MPQRSDNESGRQSQAISIDQPSTRRIRVVSRTAANLHLAAPMLLALVATSTVAFEHGFRYSIAAGELWGALRAVAIAFTILFLRLKTPGFSRSAFTDRLEPIHAFILALLVIGEAARWISPGSRIELGSDASALLCLATALWRLNSTLAKKLPNPAILFPASFALASLLGATLLMLPATHPQDQPLSFVDALFTSTSAVCVTGLVVRNTAEGFTPGGQAIIATLIQVGGLGVVIFGSTLALLLGGRLSHRENVNLSHVLANYPAMKIASFVRFIVIVTLSIELIAAILLFSLWQSPPGTDEPLSIARRAGLSAFHAISGFCNAGFEITGDSLVPYRYASLTHLIMLPLVMLGAIGFIVIQEVGDRGRSALKGIFTLGFMRRRHARTAGIALNRKPTWSLHTRLVLWTSLALYAGGTLIILATQLHTHPPPSGWSESSITDIADHVWGHTLDASFMSAASRTAGFNTLPMDDISPGGIFAMMLLMFAGGSPGSTGGGVKTVVVALLVLAVIATLRGREETEIGGRKGRRGSLIKGGRSIPDTLVKKAAAIAFSMAALIAIITMTLLITENAPFEVILFEAVSGCTTTGLSLGLTPELSTPGKLILILGMFLGRVGPLTLFAALLFTGSHAAAQRYKLPTERVSLS